MRYPVDYNGTTLLLTPEMAGTMYHLMAHPNAPQRIPANHVHRLRKVGVMVAWVYGRGAVLCQGQAPSVALAKARATPGIRLAGKVATVNGTKVILSPAKAEILRNAIAAKPVETSQVMHVQVYQMRKLGIPIKHSAEFGGYYLEQGND